MMKPSMSKHLTADLIKKTFKEVTTVLFDADGVLWEGTRPIEGAVATFNKLVQLGKRVIIVTNNSTKTREEYKIKCESLGFNVPAQQIMSTSYVTAWFLKKSGFKGKVYLIGSPALAQELDKVGIPHTDVGPETADMKNINITDWARSELKLDPDVTGVVVGFDQDVNYIKILKAASYIMGKKGALYVATNEDQQMPVGNGIVFPGTGAIVAAVSCASNKPPDAIMGKPHKKIIECLQEIHPIDPESTIMIGDRMNTDILFGRNNGIRTILVLTGCSTLEEVVETEGSGDEEKLKQVPSFYVESVGRIGEEL